MFGIKYSLELNGIVQFFLFLFYSGGMMISIIFRIIWTSRLEMIKPYRIAFIIGSGLNFLAFILQWFDSNKVFDFGNNKKIMEKRIHLNSKVESLTSSSFSSSETNY